MLLVLGNANVRHIVSSRVVVCFGCWGVRFKDRKFSRRYNHVGVSPFRTEPRVTIHVFGIEFATIQQCQWSAETGGQVSSDQWEDGESEVASLITGFPSTVT